MKPTNSRLKFINHFAKHYFFILKLINFKLKKKKRKLTSTKFVSESNRTKTTEQNIDDLLSF
jgi:hypothetical protein